MSRDIPVAESKSEVNKMRGYAFAKRSSVYSQEEYRNIQLLQEDRAQAQSDISKLLKMIDDESIPITKEELMKVNGEVNRLMQVKSDIEADLTRQSHGDMVFPRGGVANAFTYYGRAKSIKQKLDEEERERKESEKRKVFEISHVVETEKVECVKEALEKVHAKISSTAKKTTRFDESDSD